MPDVGRSDSLRSDSSQRPRVSFNRDVHIKRIGRSEGGVIAALSSDGDGHLIATPVRRERGQRTRSELAKEAALILKQADQVRSIPEGPPGVLASPYNSLRVSKYRKRRIPVQEIFNDGDQYIGGNAGYSGTRGRLTRSVSDASKSSLKSLRKDNHESQDEPNRKSKDKKLSIFATLDRRLGKSKKGKTKNEVKELSPILEDDGSKSNPFSFTPKIVIEPPTPVDEKYKQEPLIENKHYDNKNNRLSVHRKNSFKGSRKRVEPSPLEEITEYNDDTDGSYSLKNNRNGYENLESVENKQSMRKHISRSKSNVEGGRFQQNKMLTDNLSLTNIHINQDKGKDVKKIVRELSKKDTSRVSLPKTTTNILVDPTTNTDRQHNMNRPFSYIHPNKTPTGTDQIIYAQVVCSGGDAPDEEITKKTVHTSVGRRINEYAEVDTDDANMTANDSSILDHLSQRRDRLVSRLDSHKKRFQQNILTNNQHNFYNDNQYIDQNDISKFDNYGSISDLTTKERYFEHHIKTTASFRHKEFLSDSPTPSVLSKRETDLNSLDYDSKIDRLGTYDRKNTKTYREKKDSDKSDEEKMHRSRRNRESLHRDKSRDDQESRSREREYYDHSVFKDYQDPSSSKTFIDSQKSLAESIKQNKDSEKKSSKMDKVRKFVTWNKKNKTHSMEEESDPVRARYVEYKGSELSDTELKNKENDSTIRRASTPVKTDSAWFKSLKKKSKDKGRKSTTSVPEECESDFNQGSSYRSKKDLRFFGDSDKESNQQFQNHQARILRPPPESSAESTLDDESGHSQKSVVYLHAAAVGDIPGSKKLHSSQLSNGRRALSREELSSNKSTVFVPHTRTLSRSISVLAPWKPRHPRDGIEINYNDSGKPPRSPVKTTTKTPSKPEKKKQKETNLGRRGSDESKKSGSSYYSHESSSSNRRIRHDYGVDTVDKNGLKSSNKNLKKNYSEENLLRSNPNSYDDTKTSGWFRSRK